MVAARLSIEYAQFIDAELQILEKIIMKLPLPKLSNINTLCNCYLIILFKTSLNNSLS